MRRMCNGSSATPTRTTRARTTPRRSVRKTQMPQACVPPSVRHTPAQACYYYGKSVGAYHMCMHTYTCIRSLHTLVRMLMRMLMHSCACSCTRGCAQAHAITHLPYLEGLVFTKMDLIRILIYGLPMSPPNAIDFFILLPIVNVALFLLSFFNPTFKCPAPPHPTMCTPAYCT